MYKKILLKKSLFKVLGPKVVRKFYAEKLECHSKVTFSNRENLVR